jgi:hypothetical protein
MTRHAGEGGGQVVLVRSGLETILYVVGQTLLLQAILFVPFFSVREFKLGASREVLDVVIEVPS